MTKQIEIEKEIFKDKSKTFSFAALIFEEELLEDVTKLYFVLRSIDDIADSFCDETKMDKLEKNFDDSSSNDQILKNYYFLKSKYKIPDYAFREFLSCMRLDLKSVRLESEDQLLSYCYGAAGTVGILMCYLMRIKNKKAYYHAVDLGIAMQITNICRDVWEDFDNDKIYLNELVDTNSDLLSQEQVNLVRVQKIGLAEKYYESGLRGLKYLPFRCIIAILCAAIWYREIGRNISKDTPKNHRVKITLPRKITLIFTDIFPTFFRIVLSQSIKKHDKLLHRPLSNFRYKNNERV